MMEEYSKAMDFAEQLMREYHSLIITASSILISLPLIGLSVLASVTWLPHFELGIVAVMQVVSVVLFALSLSLTVNASGAYLLGKGIYAGLLMKEELERKEHDKGLQDEEKDWLEELKQTTSEAVESWKKHAKLFRPEAIWFFEGGLVFLVLSLVALAAFFLT